MDGWGGAQRPVWGGNELKKTGARSARARTRGQNPLVIKYCTFTKLYMQGKSANRKAVFLSEWRADPMPESIC
jgi:hypothetical protein